MIMSLFFQWFGLFSFIGMIILFILVKKELKKQLPTEEEKSELLKRNFITSEQLKDKKLTRAITADFRVLKKYENMQQK